MKTSRPSRKSSLLVLALLFLFQGLLRAAPLELTAEYLLVYGDSRSNHLAHRRVVEAMAQMHPKAVFHVGDLVEDGRNPDEWTTFNAIASQFDANTKMYPALGNHENNAQLYFDNFELPNNERWYSVDLSGIHFIILDNYSDLSVDSEQYRWLKSDLQSIGAATKFIAVVMHLPLFTTGKHREAGHLKETLLPLFKEHRVDIVFTGHDHDYERSFYDGTTYIVTGGGGAPLTTQTRSSPFSQVFVSTYHFCALSVVDEELLVQVLDDHLRQIDRFTIRTSR